MKLGLRTTCKIECPIVLFKTGLVKCFAAITQRMIHIDQNIAIHRTLRINQRHAAGKILGNLRAGVSLVRELLQRDAVRFVIARRTQRDLPGPARARKCLRRTECVRNQPGAERRRGLPLANSIGTISIADAHHVAIIDSGGARNRFHRDLRAGPLICDRPGGYLPLRPAYGAASSEKNS